MNELMPALIALGGVIAGAILQFVLSRTAEKRKSFEKLQTDAYVDFIKGITGVAMAQRFGDKNGEFEASSLFVDAKIRIGIYGDSEIAKQVGAFSEEYGDMSKREDMIAFVNLMKKMRSNVIGSESSDDWLSISQILFSSNLKA
jgi:hypothetical protein